MEAKNCLSLITIDYHHQVFLNLPSTKMSNYSMDWTC
jgi:hypothetical protein